MIPYFLALLATNIINEFKEEYFNSVDRLIEELETRNYFKPLLELGDAREDIEAVKRGVQSSGLTTIMKSLENLHKLISSKYHQLKNTVPYKHYTRLIFKLMFYSELIKKHLQQ